MLETNPLERINGICDAEIIVKKIMAIFGIELTAEECRRMITVGDLHQCILEKLGPELSDGCISRAAFYRLRRVMMVHYGVERQEIRPEGSLIKLIPTLKSRRTRRNAWKQLSERSGVHIPNLGGIAYPALFALIVCGILLFTLRYTIHASATVSFLIAISSIPLVSAWSRPCSIGIPQSCATVGGLSKAIMRLNYGKLAREKEFRNTGEVWAILQGILIEECGLEAEEIRPEARFQEDLEID